MQLLIVDDDDFALSVLENTLARMGHNVVTARDGVQAMEILRRGEIRLIVTDWDMPEMNGVDLCRLIRREDLSGYVYIIMLTGREGAKQRMEGLCAGADDFLNKPLDPEEMLVCMKTAERILSLETRDLALFALAKLAESRDSETGAHVERVQNYTRLLGRHLSAEVKACYGVDAEYLQLLYQTSALHDLGKVGIPDTILLKPGKLTQSEFEIMKTHTTIGAQTLDAALRRFPNARFLQIAREVAASHHEKFDGSGYPQGLVGDQIPLCGRIVAIADVYDALTSRRVYKDAMTHEQAKAIILRDRGNHFDPEIVEAFMRAEDQIVEVMNRLRDEAKLTIQPVAIPAPPAAGQGETNPCTIMVVEDDPVILEQLKKLLTATGFPVVATTNGQEAIALLETYKPRVVVSDWEMPKTDGLELCKYIRAHLSTEPAHFIMLTAHSDRTRLLDAYNGGVDDFIGKPFDAEELLARVRSGIRASALHDELVRKATGSQVLNGQLATLNSRLERLSITDELTGLFNRRHAMTRLEEQWGLAERYGRPLSVAMVDIDHFKKINDTHGHDAGDAILRRVAAIIREQTRGTDAVCRVGGEEFLIIFPGQMTQEVLVCAERCRVAVASHAFNIGTTTINNVTISIGLAMRVGGMAQFPDLLRLSDQALYAAKHAGRNVVRTGEQAEAIVLANEANGLAAAPQQPARAPIDMQVVLKRCGGDPKFAAAVTDRFRLQAGAEVGKIENALMAGDTESLRRCAHSLKSMAAYMSADAASELAKQIEELARANTLANVAEVIRRLRAEVDRAVAWINQNTATRAA